MTRLELSRGGPRQDDTLRSGQAKGFSSSSLMPTLTVSSGNSVLTAVFGGLASLLGGFGAVRNTLWRSGSWAGSRRNGDPWGDGPHRNAPEY
jgi:hypothetical protein